MTGGRATLSIVIPVLGDRAALRRLLPRIRTIAVPATEIIVVDGRPDSDGIALCETYDCIHLPAVPSRGLQNHAGAMRASGDLLWFLHADAEPPADGPARIAQTIADGAVGGCFRFRFSGPDRRGRRLLATLINYRAALGTPYGDQGLFASRAAYEAAGGFPDQPLFEEVPLIRALRQLGEFRMLAMPIGVSPRRWERDGWIRRTVANRILALGYMLGVSPNTLARRYRPAQQEIAH
jgi:rSAM/selenodomain-associated transferase 2